MNKRFIFIGCVVLWFLSGCASVIKKEDILLQAQQIKAAAPPEPAQAFVPANFSLPDPEKLVYNAKYLGITIGQFIIINNGNAMFKGRETYHFELIVKIIPFFAKILKTKDRYVSYMDRQELVVLRHEEYVKGGTVLESAVDFDYENHTASYKNFIDLREEKVDIPDKTVDVLSGGFYLRMVPWQLGDTVELKIYADQKIYDFIGLLHAKTAVNMPSYGRQEAHSLKPYVFLNEEQIKKISAEVFFLTTEPRKCLRAVLKAPVGSVSVVLVEGLK
ncbi:MAG: DUF3108 domain-containing protein [Candidatus Omnitrophota bacterium]|nr:DUF3108 domain-containing protein [Candidatus Omnitrophota bacterium]